MDEARHVEVFARYIEKLDEIRPIAPSLKGILDETLETGDWMKKLVGMQIVVEGLALYAFREMRNLTEEPLLKELLTYVARDESRHHAYGVQYIERCVPCLSATPSARSSRTSRSSARAASSTGTRRASSRRCSRSGRRSASTRRRCSRACTTSARRSCATPPRGKRLGPVQGFVMPTLRRCGLLSERVAAHFHGFLRENFGDALAGEDVEEFMQHLPELPADTVKWVMGEIQ